MVTAKRKKPPSRPAKPRKAASPQRNGQPSDVCFVIMPFGGRLDAYYSTIYCPAIEAAGLEPHRADDLFRPSTIVNDIWAYTKKAKVMLADLTGKNANVFYELGLAHALAKPVILVAESMEDIPFDLRALRIILYDKNAPDWGRVLGEKIENALSEVLASPVAAVLPAFLEVRETQRPSVSPEQKELIEIKQEMDLLRRALAAREQSYTEPVRRGAEHATELIERYVRVGMPPSMIIRRVRDETGAPFSWIERRISEYRPGSPSSPDSAQNAAPASPPVSTNLPARTPAQEAAIATALRTIEKELDSQKPVGGKPRPATSAPRSAKPAPKTVAKPGPKK